MDHPIICFSHLRWDFVRQRPQHLLSRFASACKVWFWEEPIDCDHHRPYLEHHHFSDDNVTALRPRLPARYSVEDRQRALAELLTQFENTALTDRLVHWFYTPMMLDFVRAGSHMPAVATVYDCMDQLSGFVSADPRLLEKERELLDKADLVFTGGYSLFEDKQRLHANVHAFPSAVDQAHFAPARQFRKLVGMPVTLGWFGVIDERLDVDLIARLAALRPDWRIEMIGPVVKIDPASLPQVPNIHWAGPADYADLPAALGRWDVALMPFARNTATQFISPTKTPEYLAGGRPVVSTRIRDVETQYGELDGVWLADTAEQFVEAIEAALELTAANEHWLVPVDAALADINWDRTQAAMRALIARSIREKTHGPAPAQIRSATPARYDTVIVGAGFAGSVMAERLAADAGQKILLIDRRDHIGGNAFDEYDAAGVLIHRYGPHIFHTNSDEVFAYLSRFTAWRPYEHRVRAVVGDRLVPMPINRTTLEMLYDIQLEDDTAAQAFLAARAEPLDMIRTSEDVVVAAIGRELYETFFRGYTRKQWGLDPSELDKSVTARVPTRTSRDDRYFQDKHQAMPRDGYTAMFARMLDHPNITVQLGTDYRDIIRTIDAAHIVYTGPIDEYFDHRYGRLPYRSLEFVHETFDRERLQDVATINYPAEDVPYTRITEYKHLTGQDHPKTSTTREYPRAEGDPFYPIPRPENAALFKQYEALAMQTPGVTFIGRLANYRYYNMDQVVGQALAAYRKMNVANRRVVSVSP